MTTRKQPTRIKDRPEQRPAARNRETAIERVAQRLEDLVRSGDLKRGSRLPSEPRLAEILGVSRASLREALKGLVFLGLLKARAGDGTYLQPSLNSMASRHLQWMLLLEEVKYLELYELREILEPVVAQMAARRASPEDLETMRSALDGMKKTVHLPEAFIRHEMDFHNAITRASKNRAIQSMMQMMYGALAEGRHRVLPLVTDIERHCERHERIFTLIAQGEATLARRAVTADVRYAESLLEQSLKNLGPLNQKSGPLNPMPQRDRIAGKPPAGVAKRVRTTVKEPRRTTSGRQNA